MICKQCGKEIDDSAAFCPHCYTNVTDAQTEQNEQAQSAEQDAPNEPQSDAKKQDEAVQDDTILGYTKLEWAKLPYWKKTQSSDLPMRWFLMLPFLMGGEIGMFLLRGIGVNSYSLTGSFAFFATDEIAIPFCILLAAYAALYILSIVWLMGFLKKGITITLSALAVDVVINALIVWYLISTDGGSSLIFNILYLLGSIVVLITGITYFKKRAKLFL